MRPAAWIPLVTLCAWAPWAHAAKTPEAKAAQAMERARIEISAQRIDAAEFHLKRALKADPAHSRAHVLLCGIAMARADAASRGFVSREKTLSRLDETRATCTKGIESSADSASRASMLTVRVRAEIMMERWGDAAASYAELAELRPEDGRVVGGHAAALDRAGRVEASAAALEGAASRGAEFDRAARFQFAWDRFDRREAARLRPIVDTLRAEESDPRRVAVLSVLHDGLTADAETIMLAFLGLVEGETLSRGELDTLWTSLAGRPPDDGNSPWMGDLSRDLESVELPKLLDRVSPRYPEIAAASREPGRVELLARLEPDGTVGPIWVMRSTGPSFAGSAVEAVSRWRYTPARREGVAVALPYTVRVDFRMR